jgi:hypothetical protein
MDLWNGEHDRHDGHDDHEEVEAQCKQSRLADRHVVLRPAKVITPSSHRLESPLPLSAVKIAAEMATPNDAPSDEAIL